MPYNKNAYRKAYYEANKARHNFIIERARKKFQQWLVSLREGKTCKYCPESCWACLEWHHRDPKTKKFTIGEAAANRPSKARVLAEIDKCDLICTNCHKKLHRGLLLQ